MVAVKQLSGCVRIRRMGSTTRERGVQKVAFSIYSCGFLIDLLICLFAGAHFQSVLFHSVAILVHRAQTAVFSVLQNDEAGAQRGCVIRANEIYGEIRLNFCISHKSSQKGWWSTSCWPSHKYIRDAICWRSLLLPQQERRNEPTVDLISGKVSLLMKIMSIYMPRKRGLWSRGDRFLSFSLLMERDKNCQNACRPSSSSAESYRGKVTYHRGHMNL